MPVIQRYKKGCKNSCLVNDLSLSFIIQGRTAFHYACSGSSSNIVVLLLGVCPEVIEAEDMGQLRGIHYAILNSSLK